LFLAIWDHTVVVAAAVVVLVIVVVVVVVDLSKLLTFCYTISPQPE